MLCPTSKTISRLRPRKLLRSVPNVLTACFLALAFLASPAFGQTGLRFSDQDGNGVSDGTGSYGEEVSPYASSTNGSHASDRSSRLVPETKGAQFSNTPLSVRESAYLDTGSASSNTRAIADTPAIAGGRNEQGVPRVERTQQGPRPESVQTLGPPSSYESRQRLPSAQFRQPVSQIARRDAPQNPLKSRDWLTEDYERQQAVRGSAGQTVRASISSDSSSPMSFIQREESASDGKSKGNSTTDTITRIAVNLVFVLSVAVGCILLAKQWFQLKKGGIAGTPKELAGFKVIQVVTLSRGAALHLVEGNNSRFLVAIDASGIKSVNPVHSSFENQLELEDSLLGEQMGEEDAIPESLSAPVTRAERNRLKDRNDLRTDAAEEKRPAKRKPHLQLSPPEPVEPTPDMDERIIKMLLGAKQVG